MFSKSAAICGRWREPRRWGFEEGHPHINHVNYVVNQPHTHVHLHNLVICRNRQRICRTWAVLRICSQMNLKTIHQQRTHKGIDVHN